MTNHWIDVKNAKTIMVLGANPYENHPVVAQYIKDAKAHGAKLIVADPRRTRTAMDADLFMRMRPGTNGALVMGLINYIIQNNLYDVVYQTALTNRTFTDATGAGVVRSVPKWTDALFRLNAGRTDYLRDGNGYPVVSTMPLNDLTSDSDTVFQVLKARAAAYTSAVVADICDIPGGATAFEAFAALVGASHGAATATASETGANTGAGANFPGTILYAMGATQSTHAAQDLRGYSMLQMLLGNMGRAGGGVNALRGIHNVQGSTDMGLLYGDVPGYSSVPPASGSGSNYGDYMDKLYGGVRIVSPTNPNGYWNYTGTDATLQAAAGWNLQQHGFRNMIWHWFRQGADPIAADDVSLAPGTINNANFDLMPKGSGLNHLDMFKKANTSITSASATDRVKCMVVFGQNPAVTEPNLPMVKRGLRDLDTLVVIDTFESETAGADRKAANDVGSEAAGVTYLLPSSSFVEEEGSITNSGRWIQWRYKAANPQGNSKSDTEILLTLADKLVTAGAFSHIPGGTYTNLYGSQYGWTPGTDFNAGTTAATVAETIFTQMAHKNINAAPWGGLWIYRGGYGGWNHSFLAGHGDTTLTAATAIGATAISVAANNGTAVGDTLWIGTGTTQEQCTVQSINGLNFTLVKPLTKAHDSGITVAHVLNRAKSRGLLDVGDQGTGTISGKSVYSNWGWAWLKNRRVFYNNGGVAQDVSDNFVAPDYVGRYYVHAVTTTGMPVPVPYASTYRAYSTLTDVNSGDGTTCVAADPARMPKHWEPHETPNETARTKYGNTGNAPTTTRGAVSTYPLVLTTIRVTEHFQGGPTTRNIPWLCELVPEPFIELNSADAYAAGIRNGDNVYVDTVRMSGVGPFKAVVGTGTGASQKVKKGVVAIPWHWGNKGISTGASANEVTIDALEMNTKMPEYKACLCRIHK